MLKSLDFFFVVVHFALDLCGWKILSSCHDVHVVPFALSVDLFDMGEESKDRHVFLHGSSSGNYNENTLLIVCH